MAFRSDLDALVLGTLREGPQHGYAISKALKATEGGVLKLGEGQLYPALHKLEREGMVFAKWQPQEGKPPRKVYALTETGRAELDRYRQEWQAFVHSVNAVLGMTPNGKP